MSFKVYLPLMIALILNFTYGSIIYPNLISNRPNSQSTLIITPISRDIDRFLRSGYHQLSSATLLNIQANQNNYLFAYTVPNASMFIFNTQYLPDIYSIKILGVIELTGLKEEPAAGIQRSPYPPSVVLSKTNSKHQLISQNRTLGTSSNNNNEKKLEPVRSRSFIESMADFDFDSNSNQNQKTSENKIPNRT